MNIHSHNDFIDFCFEGYEVDFLLKAAKSNSTKRFYILITNVKQRKKITFSSSFDLSSCASASAGGWKKAL